MAKKKKKPKTAPGYRKNKKPVTGKHGAHLQQKVLRQALAFQQAGRLAEAEALYRQILAKRPNHPEALHYLGMIAYQAGKAEIAAELITRALSCRPDYLEAHNNLGVILDDLGRLEDAVKSYRRALELKPDFAEVLNNLGNALKDMGKAAEAAASYRRALSLKPGYAEAHNNLGVILNEEGKLAEAAASFHRALKVKPDYAEAYYNEGVVLLAQNKQAKAVKSFRRALALKPDYFEAHYNLGNAFRNEGMLEEAGASYRRALALKPGNAETLNNLGIILSDLGRQEEAIANFERALTLAPAYAEVHSNLGNALKAQSRLDEAAASLQRALTLKPDFADAHNNLGNVLQAQGKLEEAAASFRRAISLNPISADSFSNLGNVLKDQGKLEEAIASHRRALDLETDFSQAYSNLLFCLNYKPDITQEQIYNESRQWGDNIQKAIGTVTGQNAHNLKVDRRLRIGYVSPDFREHSVAYFIEPVIMTHNRERVEVYCYSNTRTTDKVTQRLQSETDHWCSIVGRSDEDVAERISEDRIDNMVDLAGHTSNNSLPVFAYKAAPIQVTWLGYPNTTGLRTIAYRLTDAVADPPGEADRLHTEKLVRLEHGFLCYRPVAAAPAVTPLPSLTRGCITFASFNNLTKIGHDVVRAWAKILQAVPDSRLLLKAGQLSDNRTRDYVTALFDREGIAGERLVMHGRLADPTEHMGLYGSVDIGLDPFPYNGTTTTCEALWMGVPVVTLRGDRHAGRVGASILHRLGLEDFIAPTLEEYIESAQELARDRQKLQKMRASLRERMRGAELMDRQKFTGHLEDVFRQMWREYCEGALTGKQ
jgi:predicted O-linked N-acetylglucosamine transferase (SPINDLY family)